MPTLARTKDQTIDRKSTNSHKTSNRSHHTLPKKSQDHSALSGRNVTLIYTHANSLSKLPPKSQSMASTALPTILKAFSLFTMTVGTLYTATGTNMLASASTFPIKTESSALADSQIRFFGGVMVGTSATIWWASNDLYERQVPLANIGAGFAAGGLGRALAGSKHGYGRNMWLYMWAEAVGVVFIWGLGRWVGEW